MKDFSTDELNKIINLTNYDSITAAMRADMGANDNQSMVNHIFDRYKELAAFCLNIQNEKIKPIVYGGINGGIKIGDFVCVNFNNVKYTLTKKSEVLKTKELVAGAADYWILKDYFTGEIFYVSEPCTITKTK